MLNEGTTLKLDYICVRVVEVKTGYLVDIPVTCDKTAAVASHRLKCLGYRMDLEEKEVKRRYKTH
jgi:hypothetical protein